MTRERSLKHSEIVTNWWVEHVIDHKLRQLSFLGSVLKKVYFLFYVMEVSIVDEIVYQVNTSDSTETNLLIHLGTNSCSTSLVIVKH